MISLFSISKEVPYFGLSVSGVIEKNESDTIVPEDKVSPSNTDKEIPYFGLSVSGVLERNEANTIVSEDKVVTPSSSEVTLQLFSNTQPVEFQHQDECCIPISTECLTSNCLLPIEYLSVPLAQSHTKVKPRVFPKKLSLVYPSHTQFETSSVLNGLESNSQDCVSSSHSATTIPPIPVYKRNNAPVTSPTFQQEHSSSLLKPFAYELEKKIIIPINSTVPCTSLFTSGVSTQTPIYSVDGNSTLCPVDYPLNYDDSLGGFDNDRVESNDIGCVGGNGDDSTWGNDPDCVDVIDDSFKQNYNDYVQENDNDIFGNYYNGFLEGQVKDFVEKNDDCVVEKSNQLDCKNAADCSMVIINYESDKSCPKNNESKMKENSDIFNNNNSVGNNKDRNYFFHGRSDNEKVRGNDRNCGRQNHHSGQCNSLSGENNNSGRQSIDCSTTCGRWNSNNGQGGATSLSAFSKNKTDVIVPTNSCMPNDVPLDDHYKNYKSKLYVTPQASDLFYPFHL